MWTFEDVARIRGIGVNVYLLCNFVYWVYIDNLNGLLDILVFFFENMECNLKV